MSTPRVRPKLAVFKLASCDGCQLTLLNCEDALLALTEAIEVATFLEASRAVARGPYDLALVEGSITTARDAERIRRIRRSSRVLVAIGACACAGGIQGLRNFVQTTELVARVYPTPEYVSTLETSTPIAQHVRVDLEVRGCPVAPNQILEVVAAFLAGRRPRLPTGPVCLDCKMRAQVCVMVARGTPCLGPVTQAGCGAVCPSYSRGCYGCFGPMESPNTTSLAARWEFLGVGRPDLVRAFRTFNAGAAAFRAVGDAHEPESA